MDQGYLNYSLSCQSQALIPFMCKTCSSTACMSCYSGYYLYSLSKCVSNCGTSSLFSTYNSSGSEKCIGCLNNSANCSTCLSATVCLTCQFPTTQFLYEDGSCKTGCDIANGYYKTMVNSVWRCERCWDPDCKTCTDGTSRSCTKCLTGSLTPSTGQCNTNCETYESNGQCLPCDFRCDGCDGPT